MTRPNQPQSASGPTMVTHTVDAVQTWRQVGWHGQTGDFYALHEDPSPTEPGSFSPLWLLIENEPPIFDDHEETL